MSGIWDRIYSMDRMFFLGTEGFVFEIEISLSRMNVARNLVLVRHISPESKSKSLGWRKCPSTLLEIVCINPLQGDGACCRYADVVLDHQVCETWSVYQGHFLADFLCIFGRSGGKITGGDEDALIRLRVRRRNFEFPFAQLCSASASLARR